jgi:hypothetical protein
MTASNWIKLTDRTPSHDGDYLVHCGKDSEGNPIRMSAEHSDGKWFVAGDELARDVIWWAEWLDDPEDLS